MKKIVGIISVILVIGIVVFFIMNRTEATTLGDIIHKELASVDDINEIYLSNVEGEYTTLTNLQDIEKVIENPANMNLNKVDNPPDVQYSLTIRTENENDITIAVGEERIDIWDNKDGNDSGFGGIYKIKGDNSLLNVINESNYDWEAR